MKFASLNIPRSVLDAAIAHARTELPNECCGLLAGIDGRVARHFPIRNDLASPTEYLTNARDLLNAMRECRATGVEVLAIYHSHPSSDPVPSKTDIARNTWGDSVVHLIVGFGGSEPLVRVWRLAEAGCREAKWNATSDPS